MIKFDSPLIQSSLIKVIGVGGGGSNAVNYMYNQGIQGVDFIVCNTDLQALDASPVPIKIQLGAALTEGLGAGSIPEIGKNSAIEDLDKIQEILEKNTRMVFITAGMGGGTGTGGAPVIAAKAREMGLLTVGIVTIPFSFEGRKRMQQAEEGIKELRKSVDTLLIICNDKLRMLYGNLTLRQALSKADNVLNTAAKGIAEIITSIGGINVDLHDVKTVMQNSGVAIMGTGIAEGEDRSLKAVELALSSPLLNDNNIKGAKDILLYIRSGIEEITMDEITEITEYIQKEAGSTAQIIWGTGIDESLEKNIGITLIATGFDSNPNIGIPLKPTEKTMYELDQNINTSFKSDVNPENKLVKTVVVTEKEPVFVVKEEIKPAPRIFEFEGNISTEKVQTKIENKIEGKIEASAEEEIKIIKRSEKTKEEIKSYITKPETVQNDNEELTRINQERIHRLKELSMKLKRQGGLAELEAEPAYIRRDIRLTDITPSDESHVSRYTLAEEKSEDDKKNVELRQTNSFLHDNVD